MKIYQSTLQDVYIIEPEVFHDERGYFFESFNAHDFESTLSKIEFVQDNEACSQYGVVRGLHYQIEPFAQSKLVRVVEGCVLGVAVDIRVNSPNFKRYHAIELSAENKKQLFIPKGFAHGYVVLSESAVLLYKVDNYYSKDHERGICYDDLDLQIDWRIESSAIKISEKDAGLPDLKNAELFNEPFIV
ncbi:MAG: dTDP-4-dehydrorhamnose 3,5-epimerase [candidate division Zixibacteria bacterium]|nr:dTDP-4-dehydrorhamnose 3,5-epimerase [candidate division Zixibacteria bacterium]